MRRERFFRFLEILSVLLPGLIIALACYLLSYVVFRLVSPARGHESASYCTGMALATLCSMSLSFLREKALIKKLKLDEITNDRKREKEIDLVYLKECTETLNSSIYLGMFGILGSLAFAVWPLKSWEASLTVLALGTIAILFFNALAIDLAKERYAHPESYLRRRVYPGLPKA